MLRGRYEMQAADAAQVGFHEAERVLPHRTDEIDHGVEPAEYRVVLALAGPPAFPQPLFFVRRQAEDLTDRNVLKVELRQALEGVQDRLGDKMDVRQLIGQHRN